MRGLATAVAASMLWMIFAMTVSLVGVPGVATPMLLGLLITVGVFAIVSAGYRTRLDHAEET